MRPGAAVRVAVLTPVAALAVGSCLTMKIEASKDPVPSPIVTAIAEARALIAPARVSRAVAAEASGRSAARATFTSRDASPGYSDIPSVAFGAYQRAEIIMQSADKSCRLDWTLVAAIGFVESNHGRSAGSRLDADGVARPGIRGVRLDGSNGTATIRDTDGGQFDHDDRFDRAVGPMQIIPSTWSVVGVDADGDSKRDPQDIDDAALAAALYLCADSDDLSTHLGRRRAVYRYRHSNPFVDLVLAAARSYERAYVASLRPSDPDVAVVAVEQPATHHPDAHEEDGMQPTGSPHSVADSTSPTPDFTTPQPDTTSTSETASSTPTSPPASPTPTSPTASPTPTSPTAIPTPTSPTASPAAS